jgi:type IV fimbrial biogenesis protein FimT
MKRTQTAFTLLELLVALMVLGILLGLAVPTFREFSRNNRVTALHNDLTTAFTVARSEALKRSIPVSVCASKNGTSCATADDWNAGWIVFTDANGTAGSVDDPDTVVQAWTAADGGDVSIDTDRAFIQYAPTGSVNPDASSTFDVSAHGCTGDHARRLGISPTGSLAATKTSCP